MPAELSAVLAGGRRRPYAYATSHRLEEVELYGETLLLKDVRRAPPSKPSFLHDPQRELLTYTRILEPAALGTARVRAAADGMLLLERVDGVVLWQVGELDVWCDVARWLARMHARLADRAGEPFLLRLDAEYYRRWPRRAQELRGGLDHVVARYDEVVARLLALPVTVVHGEFYASNILVAGSRICPVDWEMAGAGPGLLDLAALTSGWPAEERAAIVAAYGDVPADALECCRLHLAVQWLGWSPGWSPPPEHAHDWLREAGEAAEALGL